MSGVIINFKRLSNKGNMRSLMVQRNWFQYSFFGSEPGSAMLINTIRQFKYLVHEKSRKVEKQQIVRQMLIAMAEIVFKMISLIFKRVKGFIFNFPSCPAAVNQPTILFSVMVISVTQLV